MMQIIGVGLRYYKCYEATQVIKFTDGIDKFTGFIGENGVGKSAILEALDTFFTGKNWIRNKTGKKGVSECGIAPIIKVGKKVLEKHGMQKDSIILLSDLSKSLSREIKYVNLADDELLVSCFLMEDGALRLFDGKIRITNDVLAGELKRIFLEYFIFIYINAEVDIDNITDVRSRTFKLLKGSSIIKDIEDKLKKVKIRTSGGKEVSIAVLINNSVESYLSTEIVSNLKRLDNTYDYKNLKRGARSKMSEALISQLAVTSLLSNMELTKKIRNKDIGLSSMSSGQRRRAFLDFILVMLGNLNDDLKRRIIFAVDEPEISVDASSRIQQFVKLNLVTDAGISVLFTTHWYGWVLQTIAGSCVLIDEVDKRVIYQSSIENFSDLKFSGSKPYEMRMVFDFLASLGSWSEKEPEQKFVVCEGKTDFNFIKKHFPEYKILSMRGNDIINLYKVFSDYYIDTGTKNKNIVFLIDTDPDKIIQINNLNLKSRILKRISRDSAGKVKIVTDSSSNAMEKCEIEDLLSVKPFLMALRSAVSLVASSKDKKFIEDLKIKHKKETGIRAFGLDDVDKMKFNKIYSGDFKLKVSEEYAPNDKYREIFKGLLEIF